jgi:hypothetical protein
MFLLHFFPLSDGTDGVVILEITEAGLEADLFVKDGGIT